MPFLRRLDRRLALCALMLAVGAAAAPALQPAAAARKRTHATPATVRVLVKLRRGAGEKSLARVLHRLGARRARVLPHLHVVVVRVPRRNVWRLVGRLHRLRSVRFAERNRVVLRITGSSAVQAIPSDPYWGSQWGPALVDAPTAWAVTKGSSGVVVAVLDTGVDLSQPDLQGALVPGYDFVNHDADPTDDHGHGTGTAGIIAARADNGLGGSGMCPQCSVMPVKVVNAAGTATELDVASGITWATDHGARVINLSLGGTFGSTVAAAVSYATDHGTLVVAAAGNNGNSNPFYPAADPGALSVAATQPDDTLYSWSNFGSWVAVSAPGCDFTTARGGNYGEVCGTSAATPVVAGMAALAMSYAPGASIEQIRSAITSSASSHPVSGVGFGRVDLAGTLAALGATFQPAPAVVTPPPAPPAVTPTAPPKGAAPTSPTAPTPAQTRSSPSGRRALAAGSSRQFRRPYLFDRRRRARPRQQRVDRPRRVETFSRIH